MTDQTEKISKLRYRLAAVIGVAYFISQMASLSFASSVTGIPDAALDIIDDTGAILMVLAALTGMWLLFSVERKDTSLKNALTDELTKHHINKAAILGFKVTFALCLIMIFFVKKTDISAEDVTRLMLTTCLSVPYLRFAWLEAKNA